MRIVFAGHGLLIYMVTLDMKELPMQTQLEIGKRTLELQYVPPFTQYYSSLVIPFHSRHVSPSPEPSHVASYETRLKKGRDLLTRPLNLSLRAVNEDDLRTFKHNIFELVGKSFLLKNGDEEEVYYEVVEIGSSKSRTWYHIQFQGCVDHIPMVY